MIYQRKLIYIYISTYIVSCFCFISLSRPVLLNKNINFFLGTKGTNDFNTYEDHFVHLFVRCYTKIYRLFPFSRGDKRTKPVPDDEYFVGSSVFRTNFFEGNIPRSQTSPRSIRNRKDSVTLREGKLSVFLIKENSNL